MILERLVIDNFRQFFGRHEMDFATAKRKNVTVVHAENGFGKTALLNAILWGLYGHDGLTSDLPKHEHILHDGLAHSAGDETTAEATVELSFRNGDERFRIVRSLNLLQQKDDPKKSRIELEIQTVDQQTLHSQGRDAQLKVNELIPEGISPFLFFNGERIDHFAMESSSEQVTNAIHQMLGLAVVGRTIEDLRHPNVRGRLLKELKENTDDETVKLIDQEQQLMADLTEQEQRLAACEANGRANNQQLEAVKANLLANKQARDLQAERQKLETELEATAKRLAESSHRLTQKIAEDGYVLFAEGLVKSGEAIMKRLRAEHKVPARVLNTFIEDLLKAQKCICGCELREGTPNYAAVKEALTIAGDQHFNTAVGQLDTAIGVIKGSIANTRDALKQGIIDRTELRQRRGSLQTRIDEVSAQLNGKDDDNIHDLEAQRIAMQDKQKQLEREQWRLQSLIAEKTKQLVAVRQQIKEKKQKAEIADRARRRLSLVDDTVETLERILAFEREDLRHELGEEIRRHFDKVKLKPDHHLELSEDFRLTLTKLTNAGRNGPTQLNVAHSTGERQVMSLVFIASLVGLARRREELPTILKDIEGGSYPMVMDSPFGQLGEEFRSGIASWIPQLAPQVIILVTPTQYRGEVEQELDKSGRVGKRYLLAYHAPTKRPDASESVTIGGKRYRQYFENKMEFTEVKEIEA